MADSKVSSLDSLASVDRSTDLLYVVDASGPASNKMTINAALGIGSGNPVSTADTQTLTNKTLTSPIITVRDNALTIQDNADTTKQLQVQLSGITTGTTRTLTVPDVSTTIVGTDATQTLTNKTLTSPTINTPTITNPTITVDSISEFTAANGINVDGLNIKDGVIGSNGVATASIADGAVTPAKLASGTSSTWSWAPWTPTWSGLTVGNGTVTAKYIQIGKTVFFRVKLLFGGTTSITGSPITFTSPVTMNSDYDSGFNILSANYTDAGTANYGGFCWPESSTTFGLYIHTVSGTYPSVTAVTSTLPYTWTTNDVIRVQGFFEAP